MGWDRIKSQEGESSLSTSVHLLLLPDHECDMTPPTDTARAPTVMDYPLKL